MPMAYSPTFTVLVITGYLLTVVGAVLQEPWATIQAEDFQRRMITNATNPDRLDLGRGSYMNALVPRPDSNSIRTNPPAP